MREAQDTPAAIRDLLAEATRHDTPCGDGFMAWRSWGHGDRNLVLLHGGAGAWAHWVRNIALLAPHFRLWVPDLPGMGESALPPDPWSPDTLSGLLDAGMDRLAGPRTRLEVLGFSFGGMLAGHWAALRPQRITRIVSVAPAGTGLAAPPFQVMRPWRSEADPLQRREIHRRNLCSWMLHDPASADDLAAWIAQACVERDRLRNREVSGTDSLLQAMRGVRCPALALIGEEDELFRRTRPQVHEALLRAGFQSVGWLPRAGHWAPYEGGDRFNELALRMLGV